ncbi:MAG: heparan-alpha-glucosaminide N-acetyltransferase domain-containing protein [Anaerovibrio sp.]|uniref:acyltransferase family protein n=1 Tax=Anaerovibrio sp. TaxID=1872532 RepID=UPI0025EE8AE3|nr:heparan-alpha-glucosaminide N-acetyltransferase domain-containing protein [Anaerovibrio sp.]MCR5175653.1 heparan-alpha-glucosaminide N-acetyltransferase domain-containing protein [Anaerovibrio sp.]
MTHKRFISVDILRGIIISIMLLGNLSPDSGFTYTQFLHCTWEGIHIIDMAFPGFIFIMGISMSLSGLNTKQNWLSKVLQRTLILLIIGTILNHLSFFVNVIATTDYSLLDCLKEIKANFRPLGVLQRIALVYFISAFIFRLSSGKYSLGMLATILMLLSTTGYHWYNPEMSYNELNNISIAIDQSFLGSNHTYDHGLWDPEGIYGTINATASALLGLITGILLKEHTRIIFSGTSTAKKLFIYGTSCIVIGWCWSNVEIISKPLWTAPYVLVNAGIDLILLSILEIAVEKPIFHLIYHPWQAIGRNPILIYVISEIVVITLCTLTFNQEPLYTWLYHTYCFDPSNPYFTTLLYTVGWLIVYTIMAEILYAKNIIIKL